MTPEERVEARLERRRADLRAVIDRVREGEAEGEAKYRDARERVLAYERRPEAEQDSREYDRLWARVYAAQGRLTGGKASARRAREELGRLDLERSRLLAEERRFAALRERGQGAPRERATGPPRGRDAVVAASLAILREGGPLHYRDLARLIRERGLATIGGAKPESTVGWYLGRAAKEGEGIERVAPGTFAAA